MTAAVSVQADVDAHLAAVADLYRQVNEQRLPAGRLSPRELQVACLAAQTHLTAQQISDRLHLGRETVRTHLQRAYGKLGITRRAGLLAALANAGER